MITKEDFTKEVTAVLKDALAKLPETAKVSEALETAETTISDLLQAVKSKEDELALAGDDKKALQQQVDELMAKTKELEEQLAAREAELKDINTQRAELEQRATAAEAVLAEAAAAKLLETRVSELAEAKVLKSGEKLEAQKAKIAAMTDEEFAAYREELVDLRLELEAALVTKETAADEAVVETEEVVEVAPPAIKEEAAAAGALNVEIEETPTQKAKYIEFAQALAKLMGPE